VTVFYWPPIQYDAARMSLWKIKEQNCPLELGCAEYGVKNKN